MRRTLILCLLALIAIAVPASAAPQSGGTVKHYKLNGVVQSVQPNDRRLTVKHDDIPGFMSAMTMPYKVGSKEDLKKVAPGDQIHADVVAGDNDIHLENIQVVGHPGTDKAK